LDWSQYSCESHVDISAAAAVERFSVSCSVELVPDSVAEGLILNPTRIDGLLEGNGNLSRTPGASLSENSLLDGGSIDVSAFPEPL
jgi:hypothetical protein